MGIDEALAAVESALNAKGYYLSSYQVKRGRDAYVRRRLEERQGPMFQFRGYQGSPDDRPYKRGAWFWYGRDIDAALKTIADL